MRRSLAGCWSGRTIWKVNKHLMVGSEGCFYAKTSPQATRSDGSCCPAGSCRITGEPLLLLLNVFFPREFSCSSIGLITMSWKIHGVVYVITFISLFLSNNKHFPINISPFQTQQHENFFLAFISINLDYELNCISCPWICVVPPHPAPSYPSIKPSIACALSIHRRSPLPAWNRWRDY